MLLASQTLKLAELSVTTFWTFVRELSTTEPDTSGKQSRTVDLLTAGTMMRSWLPQPALRIGMTTAFDSLSTRHRT